MFKKILILTFALFLATIIIVSIAIMSLINKPSASLLGAGPINASEDPKQSYSATGQPITITNNTGSFVITPVADYKIAARVVSKKNYSWDWSATLAPVDLALVWGDLATNPDEKTLRYSQSNRWYYFNYDAGCPFSESYIYTHSANNHIIPANDTIKRALDSIKTKDLIVLEGYLVSINGKVKNASVWWNSSKSRNDRGDGSCELVYVKSLTLNNMVYK